MNVLYFVYIIVKIPLNRTSLRYYVLNENPCIPPFFNNKAEMLHVEIDENTTKVYI